MKKSVLFLVLVPALMAQGPRGGGGFGPMGGAGSTFNRKIDVSLRFSF